MAGSVRYRLYDNDSGSSLSLEGSAVTSHIVDRYATVNLTQRFTVPSHWTTDITGVYQLFDLAGLTVCGFEMVRQDGSKVEGIARDYRELVRDGEQAGPHDVPSQPGFSIHVGTISPGESVTVNVRYTQTLEMRKRNSIVFAFPKTLAQRNVPASPFKSVIGDMPDRPFRMNVTIQQASAIERVVCASGHSVSVRLGTSADAANDYSQSSYLASVTLISSGFLTEDVVLVTSAPSLLHSRCFVESYSSRDHLSAALVVNFVPRFELPETLLEMEYIFLVDLSGSMAGENIRRVREALVVLLRCLPAVGTRVNIISVGSEPSKLWHESRVYSQETLEEATNHIDSMQIQRGRADFSSAFQLVEGSLSDPLRHPVSVFALTDSTELEVYSSNFHRRRPQQGIPTSNNMAYRIFMLILEDQEHNNMYKGVAPSFGRNSDLILYSKQGEALVGKGLRLIKAARETETTEVEFKVIWDVEEREGMKRRLSENIASLLSPRIEQSPLEISNTHLDAENQVCAIIYPPGGFDGEEGMALVKAVKVRATLVSTGDSVEEDVPISKICPPAFINGSSIANITQFPFLHTLTAKALMADRSNNNSPAPATGNGEQMELGRRKLEQDVVRWGTKFGLASRFTKFVGLNRKTVLVIDQQNHPPFEIPPPPATLPVRPFQPPAPLSFPTSVPSSPFAYANLGGSLSSSSSGLAASMTMFDSFEHTSYASLLEVASTATNTRGSSLSAIARLQEWNGRFLPSSQLLNALRQSAVFSPGQLLKLEVDAFGAKLVEHGLVGGGDIGATLIAVMWMEQYDMISVEEEEIYDMRIKAEKWVKGELGDEVSKWQGIVSEMVHERGHMV
ncbi:hypothetical protein D9757_003967 [Collybiopsis confluens]|uniref:Uncharacterized protein n=1 Tax=Collybiopsis confluens TaxID=2823264 RepID=A0A8H5HXH7_9AGAR|nr:hypothetical protein D9757_003967 [Collybiopsis confluens]